MKKKILLLDALPGELFEKEVDGYSSPEIELIVNVQGDTQKYPQNSSYCFERVNIDANNMQQILSIAKKFGGFHAIKMRKNVPFRKELLYHLTDKELDTPLKIIGQAGVGVDHIDIQTANLLNIEVVNTPGSNAAAVAEFTLLQMLALLRQTDWHQQQLRKGRWTKNIYSPSRSLSDVCIGLVGSGAISRALLSLLKPFNPRVTILGSSRFTAEDASMLGVNRASSLRALVSQNDIISLHLPLTAETRHLINSDILPYFTKGACLLNTARGNLVDETALVSFMQEHPGWISGVALDTFENEGAQYSTPIQGVDGVLLTPHIAGSTTSAVLNAALRIQQTILARLR
jgi:phosphoglycerate dehydrogenase-like enzyme